MKTFVCISILLTLLVSFPVYAVFDFSVWNSPLFPRQCHGDANGQGSGTIPSLYVWVNSADLQMLTSLYMLPNDYPEVYYDPRVDFNRDFRIDDADYTIIEEWYMKYNCPPDCGKKLELDFYKNYVPAGSTQTITWIWRHFTSYVPLPPSEDVPGSFALYYMDASISSEWIFIGNGTGSGPIEWQVPDIDSTQCLLLLEDLDHPGLTDVSELYFTIFQCQHDPELDTDHDCIITMLDYASFAANWQVEPNGKTIDDLATLANSWLECGNPYDSDRCSY